MNDIQYQAGMIAAYAKVTKMLDGLEPYAKSTGDVLLLVAAHRVAQMAGEVLR